MKQVPLGHHGLQVSRLGLGCMGLTHAYGNDTSHAEGERVVWQALERGITLVDTSDSYGPWTNEALLGRALRGRRERVVLSTKFGRQRRPDGSTIRLNGTPEYVREACEASLRRLATDHLDVYIYHRVDRTVPVEETIGAMADLVRAGKIRFIGLSEVGPTLLRRAHAVHPVSVLQSEYSLFCREVEDETVAVLEELGTGLMAYSPLCRGMLTGAMTAEQAFSRDDFRSGVERFSGEHLRRNLQLVERLRPSAAAKGVTVAQLSLAWVMAKGAVPIQGATTVAQVAENAVAAALELDATTVAAIEAAIPRSAVSGERWPAEYQSSLANF
jgi:aryl-alcohol dehydrogenase-like predicted oxidoreductase